MLLVFHGFTKARRLKRKNHAQDCETLSAKASRSQRPAILPWSLCFEWRPSFRWYGHLTRYAQPPDCCWTLVHDRLRKPETTFGDHASARAFQGPRVGGRMIWIGKPENHFSESCENAREMRA